MGLDFTTIRDQSGAAIYFIHDGSEMDRSAFEHLFDAVKQKCQKQCILMSI